MDPSTHLQDLTRPPALGSYLRQLLERRDFAWSLPLAELRSRNVTTLLGGLWLVLNPLLLLLVYYLLFSVILDISRGVDNFAAFLAVGIFTFHFSQRTIVAGASVVRRNQGLLRTIYFPRALLVLSVVLENLLAHLPATGVMLVFATLTGDTPRAAWLLLVPLLGLQCLFNLGASFWAARLGDEFPDFANALPFAFRLLFYGSGVLYSVEAFVSDPATLRYFELNPFYCMVALARSIVLDDPASPTLLPVFSGWSVLLLFTGFVAFRRGEATYGLQ